MQLENLNFIACIDISGSMGTIESGGGNKSRYTIVLDSLFKFLSSRCNDGAGDLERFSLIFFNNMHFFP
jgi:hypothetical protein